MQSILVLAWASSPVSSPDMSSHPIPSHGCADPACIDEIGASIAGGAIGGAAGAAAGVLIGLASSKNFKIDGPSSPV